MRFALRPAAGLGSIAIALDGTLGIHNPSTIAICNRKFCTYGTGGAGLVSGDGWTWRRRVTLRCRELASTSPRNRTNRTPSSLTPRPILNPRATPARGAEAAR